MGYYIDQTDNSFEMDRKYEKEAIVAIKKLFTDRTPSIRDASGYHYGWVSTERALACENFADLMNECRFDIGGNKEKYTWICFNGEKYSGDEELFLDAISPYVKHGSYIEMRGEEGEIWRWVFLNGHVEEHYATISYDYEI